MILWPHPFKTLVLGVVVGYLLCRSSCRDDESTSAGESPGEEKAPRKKARAAGSAPTKTAARAAASKSPTRKRRARKSPAKKAVARSARTKPAAAEPDDLTRIEGVGPKISGLLRAAGITTFAALAATPVQQIEEILERAGSRYRIHDPGTWPEQAALAAEGRTQDLEKLKRKLKAGRRK